MGIVKKPVQEKASGKVIGMLLEQAVKYVHKDPEKNFEKLVSTLAKIEKLFPAAGAKFSKFLGWINANPGSKAWFIELLSRDEEQVKRFMRNMFVNVSMGWMQTNEDLMEKHGIVAPYTVLISPTMRCNLRCRGCYAGEYTQNDDMPIETFQDIIRQAKDMGTYFFTILGGEPFVRFWELADVFEENSDCLFQVFTNGTLITEEVADRLKQLKNVVVAFSVNGDEKETEYMRGPGVYEKVLAGMQRMKERNLLFGTSLVLTRHNFEIMTNPDFYLSWRDRGVIYAWNFLFMPVGKDASTELMPTPEQRYKYGDFIQHFRNEQPFYIMDFWADAPFVHGCIAGGRRYLHINHKGDVEPCIFAHFAVDNIHEKPLLECLKSSFFADIRMHQPHTDNLLRPCMIIDNPEVLRNVVERNNAKPTHEGAEVILERLAPELDAYARSGAEYLDPIWEKDWKKAIEDMEKRGESYGESMDRILVRERPDRFMERITELRKHDPEFAGVLESLAELAQKEYGQVPELQKLIVGKDRVSV
ncbi:MAG TPA: radical SAM protein [Thermotogota bacterium]|nr:radical SAM protein [Thermotogota bacterium]HRW91437.1 radical SAM protein [Thermotogota bacterium]